MPAINVKQFVQKQKQLLREETILLTAKPKLTTILVGSRPDSQVYVKNKAKVIEECLMQSETITLPESIQQEELNNLITSLSNNKAINGILLQLPLPKHLNQEEAIDLIDPLKDVDGLTLTNQAKLFRGEDQNTFIQPCTPLGIVKLLEEEKGFGSNTNYDVVVIGRSNLLGNPLAQMLMRLNCNVTQLHSKTKGIIRHLKDIEPEIICLCTGQRDLLSAYDIGRAGIEDYLTTIIDAGIIRDPETNKIRGDFRKEDYPVLDRTHIKYTTVPSGIGLTTTTMLAYNLLKCYKLQQQ